MLSKDALEKDRGEPEPKSREKPVENDFLEDLDQLTKLIISHTPQHAAATIEAAASDILSHEEGVRKEESFESVVAAERAAQEACSAVYRELVDDVAHQRDRENEEGAGESTVVETSLDFTLEGVSLWLDQHEPTPSSSPPRSCSGSRRRAWPWSPRPRRSSRAASSAWPGGSRPSTPRR